MNIQQYNDKYVGHTIELVLTSKVISSRLYSDYKVEETDTIVNEINQDAKSDGLTTMFLTPGAARIMLFMPDVLNINIDKDGIIKSITKDGDK